MTFGDVSCVLRQKDVFKTSLCLSVKWQRGREDHKKSCPLELRMRWAVFQVLYVYVIILITPHTGIVNISISR